MSRVKRGTIHVKKRRSLLKLVKGYKWGRKNRIRLAKDAAVHAGAHAYIDRRKKKRYNRGLWQIKIGAFVRARGLSYSKFINLLKQQNIELDRKVLADLAANEPHILGAVVDKVSVE